MQETRQAIINILKERGHATVEQLSEELHLTPVTIRHHLDILRGEGLVQAPEVVHRPTPGRPQHAYALTDEANRFFPNNHVQFADLMLREIRERLGPASLDELASKIGRLMAADAPPPVPDEALPDRLQRVVDFLNQKGYVTRWESTQQGYVLRMANCPYQELSRRYFAPCVMDMALLTELMGDTPQRLTSMCNGDMACSYLVRTSEVQQSIAE
jgi:predicted ArsR family transcriptional regulator